MRHVLITNDDGVESPGLLALKEAIEPVARVSVIAPDGNRSGVSRALTISRGITVQEVILPDGSPAFALDGTPVDCVRMASLGLLGETPDVVVSGINLGVNAGDDVTYSGTVGAALEGVLLGWGAIAVSQYLGGKWHGGMDGEVDFGPVARFVAELLPLLGGPGAPEGTMLNVNAPRVPVRGARVAYLGRRTYNDRLDPDGSDARGHRYRIYDAMPSYRDEPGSDLVLLDEGYVTVTPMHLRLTDSVAAGHLEREGLPDPVPEGRS
jgi:5'-nucleotidase